MTLSRVRRRSLGSLGKGQLTRGSGKGGVAVVGSPYDPTSNAIFAAFTTPPTTARKNLIDNCVVALKSAGVWSKLDALYMLAAADSQAATINWKQPGTYNSTLLNSPAFTVDRGFASSGTQYIDTGFNPAIASSPQYVLNSASAFAWSLTSASVGTGTGIIGTSSTPALRIFPNAGGNLYGRINDSFDDIIANADGSGFYTVCRTAPAGFVQYKNGLSVSAPATVSDTLQNSKIYIFSQEPWAGQCAAAGAGGGMTGADNTALYNALRAYMTGVGAVAAYTGPGDLVSGATAWYGLRGYSGAYAAPGTNKAINIRRASDNATLDIVIKPDGTLDVAAATTFLAATTGFVTKLYDQSGNGRDVVQVTAAQQPQLLLSGSSASIPCMSFDGVNDGLSGAFAAAAVPTSVSAIAERINASAFQLIVESGTGSNPLLYYGSGATQLSLGSGLTASASDTFMHAFNGEVGSSGSNGAIVIDGTRTTGSTGSTGTLATINIGLRSGGSLPLNGFISEVGVWNALAFTTGNETALNTNQHAYWGF